MAKKVIGQMCWWYGGGIVGSTGVYEGEDPNSWEVYDRARKSAQMLPDRPQNGPLDQLRYLYWAQTAGQKKFYTFPQPRIAA